MDDGRHYLESADLLENYSFAYSLHAPSRSINIACIHEPIRKASVDVIATVSLSLARSMPTSSFIPGISPGKRNGRRPASSSGSRFAT